MQQHSPIVNKAHSPATHSKSEALPTSIPSADPCRITALCSCVQSVSLTSLFLASKIEETPCKLLDLLRAFDRCLHRRFTPPTPTPSSPSPFPLLQLHSPLFVAWRAALLPLELSVLAALGYSLLATHPQRLVLHLVQSLSPAGQAAMTAAVMQRAFALLNTAYLSPVATAHPPHVLAIAAIAITLHRVQQLQQAEKDTDSSEALSTEWLQLFDVTADEVQLCMAHVCEGILTAGDGAEYVAVSADDEVEQRRRAGDEQWEQLRKQEAAEEEQRMMAEIRRIAIEESLKTLRSA